MSSFNPQKPRQSQKIQVRNSFELTDPRVQIPPCGSRAVSFGDKMFARLVLHGKTILEFVISTVNNLTELYCLLHSKCRGLRGLAKLYLRNMSRGWSEERPLMLYAEERKGAPKGNCQNRTDAHDKWVITGGYNARPDVTVAIKDVSYGKYFEREVRQLSFSWD